MQTALHVSVVEIVKGQTGELRISRHITTWTSSTYWITKIPRTYKRTRISKANKSNYRPANPTTGQDIFSSWFYDQSY